MQLTNTKPACLSPNAQSSSLNIKPLLMTATCALLGTSANAAQDTEWQFDTAIMYYDEVDRVSAAEGIVSATKEFKDEHFLNLKFTFDSLTGASANGAVAQPNVQTFTRPSGKGSYHTNPGETPLDDTFKDTRVQLNANWTQPLSESYLASAGLHISKEYDYLSLGINSNIARYLNKKNTTISLGLSYSYDVIEPEGDIPQPLSSMQPAQDDTKTENIINNRIDNNDDKTTTDVLFGVTQVINRRMITQFNYSLSNVDGYQSDPFKVVSSVDHKGLSQTQRYENRPDNRLKQSVFAQTKYHLNASIIDFSYRYMWDDWEIKSHTIDIKHRLPLFNGYLEPHIRYYMQDEAEFYQPFLLESEPLPKYISADYRIGKMNAYTLGFKYSMVLAKQQEVAFRIEYYRQSPDNPGTEEIGVLKEIDLFEKIEAVIAQVSYSF